MQSKGKPRTNAIFTCEVLSLYMYMFDYIVLIEVVVLGPIYGFIWFIFWTEDNTYTLPLDVIL